MPRSLCRPWLVAPAGSDRDEVEGGRLSAPSPTTLTAGAGGAPDAVRRVRRALVKNEAGCLTQDEARERMADIVRLRARLRNLDRKLGRTGVAEMSPYLESLLRLASGPRVAERQALRRAASY